MICSCVSTIIRNKTLKMKNILEISTCSVSFVSRMIKKKWFALAALLRQKNSSFINNFRGEQETHDWHRRSPLWQPTICGNMFCTAKASSISSSDTALQLVSGFLEMPGWLKIMVSVSNLECVIQIQMAEGPFHMSRRYKSGEEPTSWHNTKLTRKHEDRYIWKVIGQPRSLAASEARWWLLPVSVRRIASMCHNHCQRGKAPMCCCVKLNSRKTLLKDENWHFASIKVELQLSIIYVVK